MFNKSWIIVWLNLPVQIRIPYLQKGFYYVLGTLQFHYLICPTLGNNLPNPGTQNFLFTFANIYTSHSHNDLILYLYSVLTCIGLGRLKILLSEKNLRNVVCSYPFYFGEADQILHRYSGCTLSWHHDYRGYHFPDNTKSSSLPCIVFLSTFIHSICILYIYIIIPIIL